MFGLLKSEILGSPLRSLRIAERVHALERLERWQNVFDREIDKTLSVASAEGIDHSLMVFKRGREQIAVSNPVPSDTGCLDPEPFDQICEILIGTGRPDPPM